MHMFMLMVYDRVASQWLFSFEQSQLKDLLLGGLASEFIPFVQVIGLENNLRTNKKPVSKSGINKWKYFRKEEQTLWGAVWRMLSEDWTDLECGPVSSEDWTDLEWGPAAFNGFRYFDEQVFGEDYLATSASYDN